MLGYCIVAYFCVLCVVYYMFAGLYFVFCMFMFMFMFASVPQVLERGRMRIILNIQDIEWILRFGFGFGFGYEGFTRYLGWWVGMQILFSLSFSLAVCVFVEGETRGLVWGIWDGGMERSVIMRGDARRGSFVGGWSGFVSYLLIPGRRGEGRGGCGWSIYIPHLFSSFLFLEY